MRKGFANLSRGLISLIIAGVLMLSSVAAPLGESFARAQSDTRSEIVFETDAPSPDGHAAQDLPEKEEVTRKPAAAASGGQAEGGSESATPEPVKAPEPTKAPEASATPEPAKAPEAQASATPEPAKAPEAQASATPEPTKAPEAQASDGPDAEPTPDQQATPDADPTPEPTITPAPTDTPQGEMVLLPASDRKKDLKLGSLKYLKGGMRIPVLYQFDYKTAVATQGDRKISVATSGCGATSVSMVIAYLTGNRSQTPYTLFRWAAKNGMYSGDGLDHSTLSKLASKYGVKGRWIGADDQRVIDALNAGCPVIAHMGKGTFTDDGHYIVLRGIAKDGKVYVNDPNSASNSKKSFALSKIIREGKTSHPFMICSSDDMPEPSPTPDASMAKTALPHMDGAMTPAPEGTAEADVTLTPAPEATAEAEATMTPAPEATAEAEATMTPVPEATDGAEATMTPAPEAAIEADVTLTPAPEATPEAEATMTPAPEATDGAEATMTPAPEVTPELDPDMTLVREATPAPETTAEAEATTTPAPEVTPELDPDMTLVREATPAPEATAEAEATATPAPEATAEAEATMTPAPEATDGAEATMTPAPEVTDGAEATMTPAPEATPELDPAMMLEREATPGDESAACVYEDDRIQLTATGDPALPQGAQLVVEKVDPAVPSNDLEGFQDKQALAAYRVTVQLDGTRVEDGALLDLRLAIKDTGLSGAADCLLCAGVALWQRAEAAQAETIDFTMPAGASFTLAGNAPLRASYRYEDDALLAEVMVPDAAQIPLGAGLTASSIPGEAENYAETLAANGIVANRIWKIFDMTLGFAEPENLVVAGGIPLSVRLTYKGLSLEGAEAWILTPGEAKQAKTAWTEAGGSVEFDLNGEISFAVVFARPVNTQTVFTYEDDAVQVVATLSDPSAIPCGATLQVSAVDAMPYAPVCEAAEDAQAEGLKTKTAGDVRKDRLKPMKKGAITPAEDDDAALICYNWLAYDIRFVLDGVEYEPSAGAVGVSINFKEGAADAPAGENLSEVTVVHMEETDGEVTPVPLEAVYDTTDAGSLSSVSFETDSFSVYLISNGYTMSSLLTYNVIDTSAETFTNTPYYYANRKLGIAGSFHLVAFTSLTLNTHTNGNLLAKSLTANVNFGTSGLANELSYVQTYAKVNGVSASADNHVLALGSSAVISLTDNGSSFAINGIKLDRPRNVWQDADTAALPFINLASVKSQCQSISSALSGYANSNVTANFSDMNNRSLVLTAPTGLGVYSFSASTLNSISDNDLKLTGFTSGNSGTMIVNVNCSGASTLTLPNVRMYVDGVEASTSEVTNFANGRVLWNFYNISGLTINAKLMKGSILAPGATVNLNQNLNGTVVADTISVNAESHREDFVGKLSDTVTVRKVWKDVQGNTLTGTGIDQNGVTVQLYKKSAGGTVTAYGSAVTLNSGNGWKYAWSGLDADYTYFAKETYIGAEAVAADANFGTQQAAGYMVTYDNNSGISNGEITVTNQKMATTSITVKKAWQDASGATLVTPPVSSVSVSLYRSATTGMTGGIKVGASQTLGTANSWSYTFTGLDARYFYYVLEDALVAGYVTTYSNTLAIPSGIVTITNKKIATTTITVAKLWKNSDGSARTVNLPASITVELYKSVVTGGVASQPVLQDTHALTAAEGWTYTWTGLNATDESLNACQYFVREVAVTGFDPTYSVTQTAQTADGKTVYLAANGGSVTVTNRSNGNVRYIQLPLTGGTGTDGYATFGGLMILLAAGLLAIMLSRTRRRSHAEGGGF